MSQKIHDGEIDAAEASSQLAAEGVHISARVLALKAATTPGESPVKAGAALKLSQATERSVANQVRDLRKHDLTVTKPTILAMVNAEIKGTTEEKLFPEGATDGWYYGFLDRNDMNGADTKPLESDRDLWLTSTVRATVNPGALPSTHSCSMLPPRAQNAEKQYDIWAAIAVRNGMAEWAPKFDRSKPYDEMIIWYPEGLKRLVSMDETDVRTDQTKRGHGQAARGVLAQAPGSRCGHSHGKRGRKPAEQGPSDDSGEPSAKRPKASAHRGGFAGSKEGGKDGSYEGEIDKGNALATKSASKISFAGGTRGDSKSLSPHIMSDHPLSPEELDHGPVGTARDTSTGEIIPASFNVNSSGGMLEDDMIMWLDRIAAPSTGCTPTNRGMQCVDGLGQHHSYKVIKRSIEIGLDVALRFPHGSSRGQHEDFEHFSHFRPAHETAKNQVQIQKFQEMRAKAARDGREPSRAELMAASVLTDEDSLRAARIPWQEAFADWRVERGWAEEGVVPFTRKLMWDLKKEEDARGVVASRVPPVDVSGFGITPAETSTALVPAAGTVAMASGAAWDEGIHEEVQRLLRNEIGDPTLNVAPVPPPKRKPKLTSALLFKLPGGATGETGRQLIRAKEVERQLAVARTEHNKEKTKARTAKRADSDWLVAQGALDDLEAAKFDLKGLSKPQLQSLVRALQVGNANGKKDALRALLVERFGTLSRDQFAAIKATVCRGVAVAALPAPQQVQGTPLALPAPALAAAKALSGPSSESPVPLALSRPRRGQ